MAHKTQVKIQMAESSENGVPSRKLPAQDMDRRATTVTFHNICYRVKTKSGFICNRKTVVKDILRDINGIMRPGLNAILGPTGSGKSSLLDVLAARKDPHGLSGDVLINGAPQPANFKCISGYVVQDDVVMGTLTVRENFQFSAALRLSRTVSEQEKEERVNQIIKELGLTKVADSKVGTQFIRGISGGERKRTNIGMELITDPAILFLDEPTTGLDASTANAVLLLLKRMSRQGKTIIFSIHQPRYTIFKLFDNLTLLAAGKMLYHGPAQDATEYFKTIGYECESFNNPADFFLDVINGDSTAVALNKIDDTGTDIIGELSSRDTTLAEQLAEKYLSSAYYRDTKAELEKLSLRTRSETAVREITYSTSFCHQLKHEYISGYYRISAYFFSKLMADLIPMRTIPGILFTCIIYFMLGLKQTAGAFFTMMFTLIMVSYTATSMALAIAAGQSVVVVANLLMTIAFIFMIIFSGLLVNLTSIMSWLSWLKYFSIPRYGMTALQVNEFTGLNFCDANTIGNWSNPDCEGIIQLQPCTGEQYLKNQGIEATSWGLWQNHVALACMTVIFLTISYMRLFFMKKFS